MDMQAEQVRGRDEARELFAAWEFLPDHWPGLPAEQAVEAALDDLGQSAVYWAFSQDDRWQWLAGLAGLAFDSELFGRPMAKVCDLAHREPWPGPEAIEQGGLVMSSLLDRAREEGLACLVARVASRDMLAARVLEEAGFNLMDVSVEWALDLASAPAAPAAPAGYSLSPAGPELARPLAELAARSFCDLSSYADRFGMDHRLRHGCQAMYWAWVANSFSGDQADQVLALSHGGRPAGFLSLKLGRGERQPFGKEGWVVMNAMDPAHRGLGLYNFMLQEGLAWLKEAGCATARVRTKASQQAVIRAWSRLSARQTFCDLTFHNWLGD